MVLHFLNIKQSLLGVEGARCQRRSYINSADKCLPWFLSIVLVHCLADPVYNPQRGSHFNKQVMLAQRWFIAGSTSANNMPALCPRVKSAALLWTCLVLEHSPGVSTERSCAVTIEHTGMCCSSCHCVGLVKRTYIITLIVYKDYFIQMHYF